LVKLLEVDLKTQIQEFERIEAQIVSLNGELQWQRARESLGGPSVAPPEANRVFRCRVEPVSPQGSQGMILEQDFGRHQDSETGLVWLSSGWWISRLSSDVRACQDGTIAFVGEVPGRGRVILLEHRGGALTLYANLQPETVMNLTKGLRVPAGHRLGTAREKFYFEVRQSGEATNPRLALGRGLLEKMSIQATIE
jgi:murein DD-endopeptidase MepM/ murein hydrolase activator NlpD